MDVALLTLRVVLSIVFVVAGAAKLADRSGSRRALSDFGLPPALAGSIGMLLPAAELVVAALLLPAATAWWGALSASGLLLAFVVAIAFNIARGRAPDCHCFGQLHSAPAGWPTLARNGVLAAAAALVVWHGRDAPALSAVGWLGVLTGPRIAALVGGLAVAAAFGALGWLAVHLLRQHGRLLLRMDALEAQLAAGSGFPIRSTANPARRPTSAPALPPVGLPVNAPAPAFELPLLAGGTGSLAALSGLGKPVLLMFSDPGCGPCTALLPDVARWAREHAAALTVALVSRGTAEANREKLAGHGFEHVLLQRDREVASAYEAHGTPGAVLVRPDGTVGSPVAMGADAITSLVARSTGAPAPTPMPAALPAPHPTTPQVGEPAPPLMLPDLAGATVRLADLYGRDTAVLFWNPGCGYCERMLPELKAWDHDPPDGAPRLLVVSTGSVEVNRAMGLHSPVVLDDGFAGGLAFGAGGTPSAVLVDRNGRVASPVAVGGPAVLTILGVAPASPERSNGRRMAGV